MVFGLAFLAHAPALQADWVLDDHALVRTSRFVPEGPSGLRDAFAAEAWKGDIEPGVWRPLPLVTFCLEAPLWKGEHGELQAFGFHLTNLVLHALCAVTLLFVLGRLVPGRPLLVGGAAIVFAVHPMHVGTVTQLGGRADLLALLFCLLTVLLWTRRRPALLPLAVLCWFLALLSKETAVGLPLVLLGIDAARGQAFRPLARQVAAWAGLGAAFAVWLIRWPGPTATALFDSLGPALEGLGRAVLGLLAPVGFGRDRLGITDGLADLMPSLPALVTGGVVLVVAVTAALRSRSSVARGIVATALMLGLGAVVAPVGAPLEARFLYVTAPGLLLLAGALVEALFAGRRVGVARPLALGAVGTAVLLASLVGLSWREARIWKDDTAYLDALMERHPGRPALYLRFASRIRRDVELERALLATRALSGAEQKALTRDTRRALREAESLARAAIRRSGGSEGPGRSRSDAWRELGLVQLAGARAAEATVSLREALRLDPMLVSSEGVAALTDEHARRVSVTYRALARAEESVGDLREAAAHRESALHFSPGDVDLVRGAARGLIRAGLYGRGLRLLQDARGDPRLDADAQIEVEREYRQALEAAHAAAARHLEEGRRQEREGTEAGNLNAISSYEMALGADPSLLEAYGRLLYLRGLYFGQCERGARLLAAARRVIDEQGLAPDDSWRRKFDVLERELEKECADDAPPEDD